MCWVFLRLLTSVESKGNTGLRSCSGPGFKKKKKHDWKSNLLKTRCFGWCAVLDLTWMVLTTPLAMTESFPATERTPSLSWDMSGAFGSMLVNRYELPTSVRQTQAWNRTIIRLISRNVRSIEADRSSCRCGHASIQTPSYLFVSLDRQKGLLNL